ncbi:UvrD-helicase domain-containing protein [Eggerthellaceae bacterium zg-1084]|uniref:UvrD-helicase domain-containing protein n=1 Tax=Berryella wangjianweii TaxID=2734634 RepID=UPI001554E3B0|nr:UvrD-helicase domain-containing protein [Berryella wangjianweii]NPD31112.1 UvrD-helicase domain-containing protein [Berryella wangjianweii]
MALTPEQSACVNTLDRAVVVAAGAGSGKTFTLTKRIVQAIQTGQVADVHEVLAITFTQKAAGELKARIKAELRAAGRIDQALKVDDAWVSTIHGMCGRILRAHALELGIDPCYTLDDAEVLRIRDEALAQVIEEARQGALSEDVESLFEEYGAQARGRKRDLADHVRALLDAVSACPGGMDQLTFHQDELSGHRLASELAGIADEAIELLTAAGVTENRAVAIGAYERAAAQLRGLLDAPDVSVREALAAGEGVGAVSKSVSAALKPAVAELNARRTELLMRANLAAARDHASALVLIARQVQRRMADQKRQRGLMSNDDLLVQAHRALTRFPQIAARYRDRFKMVMIDEFQDTDQMQVDMARLLSGEGCERLCTVGDWQQSIYRFRGADVSVYRRHLRMVEESERGRVICLMKNFRSHADVLTLVDRVFSRPDMFGGAFMSLGHGRDESRVRSPLPPSVPRVMVDVVRWPFKGGLGGDEAREVRAARVAACFARYRDAGRTAGEMVLLLRRMTNADAYAEVLRRAGFNCVVAGGSVFGQSLEALEVAQLTRALSNPCDTESLLQALAGRAFCLSANDLLHLGSWQSDEGLRRQGIDRGLAEAARLFEQEGVLPASPLLANAVATWSCAQAELRTFGMEAALRTVFTQSGWAGRLQNQGSEGLASAANVYKGIRLVADIEARGAGPASVALAFAELLETQRLSPGALSANGGNFVRIMTVHASKGLEFPIVAVADMEDSRSDGSKASLRLEQAEGRAHAALLPRSESQGKVSSAAAAELRVGLFGEDPDEDLLMRALRSDDALRASEAIGLLSEVGEAEEAKRLLYVAITRAMEAVVLSCAVRTKKDQPEGVLKGCMGEALHALMEDGGALQAGLSQVDFGGERAAELRVVDLISADDLRDMPYVGASDVTDGEGGQEGEARVCGGHEPSSDARGQRVVVSVPAVGPRPARSFGCAPPPSRGFSSFTQASQGGAARALGARLADDFVCDVRLPAREDAFAADAGMRAVESPGDANSVEVADAVGFGVDARAALALERDAADGGFQAVGVPAGASPEGARAFGALTIAAVDSWGDPANHDIEPMFERGRATASDEDAATAVGSAFHLLAEVSCAQGGAGAAFQAPDAAACARIMDAFQLGAQSRERVVAALDRWLASDVAAEASTYPVRMPEAPFALRLGPQADSVVFEGAIDLLCLDREQGRALVVDYKTGGPCLDRAQLARKHALQAACYAAVVLQQGVSQVEAVFVCVEQPCDDASQPALVRYRFAQADLPQLISAVEQAVAAAR